MVEATAFWVERPGAGALRTQPVPAPGPDEVLVRTLFSGVSRGTEATVFCGRVPESEHERMRAPFQEGGFPAPVKYGYLNVGVVEAGAPALLGRTVFTLYPHQSVFVAPAAAVVPVSEGVPARPDVLTGAVIGVFACAAVSRILSSLLFGVSPLDPAAFGGTAAFLLGIAALASYVPARRAARVDAMAALRYE